MRNIDVRPLGKRVEITIPSEMLTLGVDNCYHLYLDRDKASVHAKQIEVALTLTNDYSALTR